MDVHTGLGAKGVDVLLGSANDTKEMEERFPKIPRSFDGFQGGFGRPLDEVVSERCQGSADTPTSKNKGSQSAGYEFTVGVLTTEEWIACFFKPNSGRPLVVTQEFGTLPSLAVARALVLENCGFHYDRGNHEYWRQFSRDAFYVRTADWKQRVLHRGEDVFSRMVDRFEESSGLRSCL